jgi:pilus assembly protein CpaE
MPRTPQILIVGSDPRLETEVASALQGIADVAAVLHAVADHRQGVEAVRSRRPDFVLVELSKDMRALRLFAEEVAKNSPESNVAAVFAPDVFGPDVSESAVLIEGIRSGIRDFLRRPLSRIDLEQLLERLLRRPTTAAVSLRNGRIISFVSNKGGVGKSTVSLNVACGLAQRHPGQVLLIDTSLQMGVAATMLDLKPATSLTDAARERDRLDETLIRQLAVPHDCGLHLLAAPADAVEGAIIDDEIMSRVLTLARRAYDFVIIDSFPLLDRVMMVVLDLSDRVYLVLESVVPTVLGIVNLLRLLDSLGIPTDRQRIVLNRYTGSTDNLKPADVALRLGRDVNFILPYQKKVTIAANIGQPYYLGANRLWGLGKVFSQLIDDVEAVTRARDHRAERGTIRRIQSSRNGTGDEEQTVSEAQENE